MKWREVSRVGKLFLLVVLAEFVVGLALTVVRMLQAHADDDTVTLRYGAVVVLGTGWVCWFAFDGALQENAFSLLFATLSTAVLLVSSVLRFVADRPSTTSTADAVAAWARLGVVIATLPLNMVLAWLTWRAFGYHVYHRVGTSARLVSAYRRYQALAALVAADTGAWLLSVLLLALFAPAVWLPVLDACVGLLQLLWAAAVRLSARKERTTLLTRVLLTSLVVPLYVGFRLLYSLQLDDDSGNAPSLFARSAVFMSVLALVCRVAVVVVAWMVRGNFGQGLRENVFADYAETLLPGTG